MKTTSSPSPSSAPTASWPTAAHLVARWLDRRERIDALLDTLPGTLTGTERARCQHLVLGVVRHFGRIDAALEKLVAHPPRFSTRAVLFIAGFELIEAAQDGDDGRTAKIVHHAVEQTKTLASPAEARLVNAVVRKLVGPMAQSAPVLNVSAEELGEYFSHPAWLVRNWLAQFGPAATRQLLEWNQRPAPVYARWRATAGGDSPPNFLKPTRWPGMFEVLPGRWPDVEPLLKSGRLYLQDPSTCLPVELLAPRPGENVLDLCAAPGGKSLFIADLVSAGAGQSTGTATPGGPDEAPTKQGRLVAVDLPGTRIERLKQNLARAKGVEVALVHSCASRRRTSCCAPWERGPEPG